MGAAASLQTTVNNINQKISNKLVQTASASATANCKVNIGSLRFHTNKGCAVNIRNLCSADAKASVQSILDAVSESYDGLTSAQKAFAPSLLTAALNIQTDVNNVVKDFETYVKQTCLADSVLNSTITVNDIDMGDCQAPQGTIMNFEFVNAGTASANCAMKAVLDVLTKSSDKIASDQVSNNDFRYYIYGAIAIAAIVGLFLTLYYVKKMFVMSTDDKIKLSLANREVPHWLTLLDTYLLGRRDTPHLLYE
ncbi:myristylated IMV envelope protein [Nile crocodilepox virus]|uniref:Myristylated IMV envelope protein n=1 Tax=Nile crocodilepox virus (isolate Crocodylus niloticus/Zimbabwe/Ume/2001) TaxID=1289473 RepID=Q070G9_CPRVZ|nr:myristylated IMV envelope protein [Nile crocodilepox virus]ABJ08973.1 myristylated IMV envelope protein [Nile crocodilepox virus]